MTREEYQKVKEVFQSVMEIADEGRSAFLDEVCGNDGNVRREVERLLNTFDSEFMEGTAVQNVADLLADEESLISGEKIGHYSIVNRLGKGGMGEVFLAHDHSLGRDVAIKVLLPEFTTDSEHVNRFKLEAKAASALNHPNIITIHEIGEDHDRLFIAAEHIVGETLRSLISRGGLTLASSIRIAEQVASALTAAHKAGIIHRDIKPENIIVREDGFVKVLDFGLAKPTNIDGDAAKKDLVETRKGVVMGSIGYLSPEQARGLRVDARTDLWSVGVIFYEMLTGTPPFQGNTKTDILANIIHKDPVPVSETIPDAPTELYRIVKKSLRKEADERYQNALDLSLDLKNLRHEMEIEHELELSVSPERLHEIRSRSNDSGRTVGWIKKSTDELQATDQHVPIDTQTSGKTIGPKGRFKTAIFAALGILVLGGSGFIGYNYLRPGKLIRTAFSMPKVEKIPITGDISSVAISPDGKYLAYSLGVIGSDGSLILRQLETGSEKEILAVKDLQIGLHSFSADGNYFYFYQAEKGGSTRTLRRVAVLGGEIRELPFNERMYPSFSPDGKKVVMVRRTQNNEPNQIVVSDADGNNEEVVYSSNENYVLYPKFSPDGGKILVAYSDKNTEFGREAKLGWLPAAGGEVTRIGETAWDFLVPPPTGLVAYYEWLRDGSGIIISNRLLPEGQAQVFLVSFPNGDVTKITNDTSSNENLSATSDSKTIVTIKRTHTSGVWEFDLPTTNGKQITVSSNQNIFRGGIVFTDDKKLLFVRADGKGNIDLWQMNADGSDEKVLVSQKGRIEPFISAEGKHIYFTTNAYSISRTFPLKAIWRIDADGSNLKQLTTPIGVTHLMIGVYPEDDSLLFREWVTDNRECKVQKLDLASGQITPIIDYNNLWLQRIQLSPDGKQILYGATERESNYGITYRLVDLDGTKSGKLRLTLPKEAWLWEYRFAPDGKSIYYFDYRNRPDIWRFDLATQRSTKITNFDHDMIFSFTVSRDGKKLYFVRGNSTDEVVLIKSVE